MNAIEFGAIIFVASILFFLLCRFVIFRKSINAEDARKVMVVFILLGLAAVYIFDIYFK